MSNSGLLETVNGFEGWVTAEGCMCQKKFLKKNQNKKKIKLNY
jgi:hypothetical protein